MSVPENNAFLEVQKKLKDIRNRTDLKLKPLKHLKSTFTDFDGVEKPLILRYYQVQGVFHLLLMKRFVLGDDTGLGKSLESIIALCCIWERDSTRKAVVLTTKSATMQWVKEFAKFTKDIRVVVCNGSPAQRQKARDYFEKATGPTVIVMGYRSAVQDFRFLQAWKDYIYIFDEATVFKTPTTQVHQVCKHLTAQADRAWGLTATLIKNHLMEGFGIYEIIMPGLFRKGDGKIMSRNGFMMYFCIIRMQQIPRSRRQIPVIVGYTPQKIEEFRQVIDPYFIGRPKHEVASELPSLTTREVEVLLTPAQDAKYAEALSGLLTLGDQDDSDAKETSKLTAIGYCQQIVNHPALINCEGESPKLNTLIELLTEGDFEDDKVIVFSRYRKMIDLLIPALEKAKIKAVRITGAESQAERDVAMKAFQHPESDVRVVCITAAGSEAINLQAAKAVICYDTPWSAGDFLQLIGRMIRIGSLHDRCYAVHLVARWAKGKTVDHKVLEVLNKKMNLVEAVLGKRIKGDKDDVVIKAENEISDLFASLRADAKEAMKK